MSIVASLAAFVVMLVLILMCEARFGEARVWGWLTVVSAFLLATSLLTHDNGWAIVDAVATLACALSWYNASGRVHSRRS